MKKLTLCIMTAFMLFSVSPTQLSAISKVSTPTITTTAESTQATVLTDRLNEIKAMDKSDLKATERKQLRKEVRSLKSQLREIGGGVYLSVGAIILIALLLILLL